MILSRCACLSQRQPADPVASAVGLRTLISTRGHPYAKRKNGRRSYCVTPPHRCEAKTKYHLEQTANAGSSNCPKTSAAKYLRKLAAVYSGEEPGRLQTSSGDPAPGQISPTLSFPCVRYRIHRVLRRNRRSFRSPLHHIQSVVLQQRHRS